MYGVYLLFWKGAVVYVGQSVQVFARICTHRNTLSRLLKGKPMEAYGYSRRPIRFDKFRIYFCKKDELLKLEREMIRLYKPRWNTVDKEDRVRKEIDIDALIARAKLDQADLAQWKMDPTRSYSPKPSRSYRRIA